MGTAVCMICRLWHRVLECPDESRASLVGNFQVSPLSRPLNALPVYCGAAVGLLHGSTLKNSWS